MPQEKASGIRQTLRASLAFCLGVAVGTGLGWFLHLRTTWENGEHGNRNARSQLAEVPFQLKYMIGQEGGDYGYGLLARANALAARSLLLSAERGNERSIAFYASVLRGDNSNVGYVLALPSERRAKCVVLVFADESNRLVQINHLLGPPDYGVGAFPGSTVFEWTHAPVADVVSAAQQTPDGRTNIESTGTLLLPDGEVAVGLQYWDGTYSNFVSLTREPDKN